MTGASVPPLAALPELVGVIHLKPLPGSPRYGGDISAAAASCGRDAEILADAGFDAIIIENYGDAPFEPRSVAPVTIAAMTRCALAARVAAPMLPLGINVLRNDAEAALAVAIAAGGSFIRVNVHTGARLTDQGLVEGAAHRTLRARRALGAAHVRLLCDVDVKHSAPLAPRPVGEEAHDLVDRGGADAVLVTGSGTGKEVALRDLDEVLRAVTAPVYVASGVTEATLPSLRRAHGLIVGSCLRADGRAGGPIDASLARRFVETFRSIRAAQAEGRIESAPPPGVVPT
jgi:hypothetical protein